MAKKQDTLRLTRRSFVTRAAWLASGTGLLPLLSACGGSPAPTAAMGASTVPATSAAPQAAAATTAPTAAAPTSTTAKAATTGAGSPAPATVAVTPTKAAAPATAAASPAAKGVPGGILRATLGAEPTTLDPHKLSTLFDRDVSDAIFDALVDDDTSVEVRGALAESWQSSDAKTWTFKLRPGAKFHDGSDVTAAVVKATIDRVLAPATGAPAGIKTRVTQVATIATPDPKVIVFELKAPNAAFPIDLAEIKIVPPNFDVTKPIGAGPFQFTEWVRNQHVKVKKFPGYYVQGLPYLDEIVFLPTPDENQKVVLLQTGKVDFIDTVPLPRVKEVQQGGKIQVFTVEPGVSPSSYFMLARTVTPPLDNPKVRQAINYAIDRKGLLDATFGVGTIKSNVMPPKHWAFNPNALSYNDRNVAKAKQLMSEAGQSGGFSVRLKHITSRAEFATIAQLFQANMADIGVKIEITPQEIGVWVDQVLNKHDFQLGLTGIIPGSDPNDIMRRYSTLDSDGKAMGWQNDEYGKLLGQGSAVVDREARKKIYFRMQDLAQEATPGFVLNERPILYAASPAVQGFVADTRQHTHFKGVWFKK